MQRKIICCILLEYSTGIHICVSYNESFHWLNHLTLFALLFFVYRVTWLGEPLGLVRLWPDLYVELYSIHRCA